MSKTLLDIKNNFYKTSSLSLIFFAFAILQIPSLRAIFKYSGEFLVIILPIYLLSTTIATKLIIDTPKFLKNFKNSYWIWILLIFLITIIVFFVYPIADGLKLQGKGSDQDDSLIVSANAIIRGESPYSVRGYLNNPTSPGPGWIILLMPLTAFKMYWLLTPLCLIFLIFSNYISFEKSDYSNSLIMLLCTSLAFWELLVVGSDFIAISALITALGNLIIRFHSNYFILFLITFLIGSLSTARIFFFIIPFVYSLMLWPINRIASLIIFFMSSSIAIIFHSLFFFQTNEYPPLHLILKSKSVLSIFPSSILIIITLISSYLIIFKLPKRMDFQWFFYFVPLSIAAIGDLGLRSWEISLWEGANYLIIPLIPTLQFITNRYKRFE